MRIDEIKIVTELDRGLAYAEACFETFRVVQGQVFALLHHQRRLLFGLKSYGIMCDDSEIAVWFEKAISAALLQGDDILVRLTVSGGEAAWGLLRHDAHDCHVQIQLMPYMIRQPLHLKTVTWPFPLREKRAKYTADYGESLRAVQQWTLEGKVEQAMQALICSAEGNVLSTLTANVALYRQGQWHSPQGLGILQGVVRQFFLQKGSIVLAACPQTWVDDCEAMVCMNSGVFVQIIASVNQRNMDIRHPAIADLLSVLDGVSGMRGLW